MTTLRSQIYDDECGAKGPRQPYKDSRGIWTVGVGHNVESGPPIATAFLMGIFDDDLKYVCTEVLQNFPFVKTWNMPRYAVIVNMCFAMGLTRLLGFKRMLHAASIGDFAEAAVQLRDSDFWRSETHLRAERLARQLESGEWVTELAA